MKLVIIRVNKYSSSLSEAYYFLRHNTISTITITLVSTLPPSVHVRFNFGNPAFLYRSEVRWKYFQTRSLSDFDVIWYIQSRTYIDWQLPGIGKTITNNILPSLLSAHTVSIWRFHLVRMGRFRQCIDRLKSVVSVAGLNRWIPLDTQWSVHSCCFSCVMFWQTDTCQWRVYMTKHTP